MIHFDCVKNWFDIFFETAIIISQNTHLFFAYSVQEYEKKKSV